MHLVSSTAIDLNLGCPQRAARTGVYGAYLLDAAHHALVSSMIRTARARVAVPLCAKIRLLPSLAETIVFCRGLVDAGVDVLTVHGRTRGFVEERRKGPADLEQIRCILEEMRRYTSREDGAEETQHSAASSDTAVSAPTDAASSSGDSVPPASSPRHCRQRHRPLLVWSNGNVRCDGDVARNLACTRADGLMVGEALMNDPTMFERCENSDVAAAVASVSENNAACASADASADTASLATFAPSSLLHLAEFDRKLGIVEEYTSMLMHPTHAYYSPLHSDVAGTLVSEADAPTASAPTPPAQIDEQHQQTERNRLYDAIFSRSPSGCAISPACTAAAASPSMYAATECAETPAASCCSSAAAGSSAFLASSVVTADIFRTPLVSWAAFHSHVYHVMNSDVRARFLHHTQCVDAFLDAASLREMRGVLAEARHRLEEGRVFDHQLQSEIDAARGTRQQARATKERHRVAQESGIGRALNSRERKRARWQTRKQEEKRHKLEHADAHAHVDASQEASLSATLDENHT
jgi:tRNA-dihydrouridine synthase